MRLFIILSVIVLAGCNKYEETKCDNYYIYKETTSGNVVTDFRYDDNGLLKEVDITWPDSAKTYLFYYQGNQKLQEVSGIGFFFRKEFRYDSKGRLNAAVLLDKTGAITDSLGIEYDAQDRIVKRSYYSGQELKVYSLGEYTGENLTQLQFYAEGFPGSGNFTLSSSYVYTYDNHHRPYPHEFYLFTLGFDNAIGVNNVTSLERTFSNGSKVKDDYKYSYNSGGYPVGFGFNFYSTSYSYSCAPLL